MGAKVRELRTEQGIPQWQLALITGISRSYLWKIEIGTADIGIDILICIARALDTPVRELVEF